VVGTHHVATNTDAVLSGDLDGFMDAMEKAAV
jgi:hypothetical protein